MGQDRTLYGDGPLPRVLVAAAAYRDKYGVTGPEPFGPATDNPRQAQDRETARAATTKARRTTPSPRPTPVRSVPSPSIGL